MEITTGVGVKTAQLRFRMGLALTMMVHTRTFGWLITTCAVEG